MIVFSSLDRPTQLPPRVRWVHLPADSDVVDGRNPVDADPTAGGALHWAPLQHPGHRSRLARIAESVAQDPLDAFVVDVSVEVTLLVRTLGVPVIVMAQPGDRDDAPHTLAYCAATLIVAPWPADLVRAPQLDGRDVVYTGGISRHEGRLRSGGEPAVDVLVLGGRGGAEVTGADLTSAQGATPDRRWRILAGESSWVDDPWPLLTAATVVVAWAGQNSVADLAVAGARAIVLPQSRPFREQLVTGEALADAGLAVVRTAWPVASEWPGLLRQAESTSPDWSRWQTTGAAGRAAQSILSVADRWPR